MGAATELPADLRTWDASPQRWRWDHVGRLEGPLARPARYFCALEECSSRRMLLANPWIPEQERELRSAQIAQLASVLVRRIEARARGSAALDAGAAAAVAPAVRTWSRIQLALALAHYGAGARALDREALADAYLAFASGRLRIPVVGRRGIGEPDSAYYFAFAEFALLACEQELDVDLWEPQLAHLVWTQEVYVHMQRPVGPGPHRFHDYAPRGRERRYDPAVGARARASVAGLRTRAELEQVHARHCREAFVVSDTPPPPLRGRAAAASREGWRSV